MKIQVLVGVEYCSSLTMIRNHTTSTTFTIITSCNKAFIEEFSETVVVPSVIVCSRYVTQRKRTTTDARRGQKQKVRTIRDTCLQQHSDGSPVTVGRSDNSPHFLLSCKHIIERRRRVGRRRASTWAHPNRSTTTARCYHSRLLSREKTSVCCWQQGTHPDACIRAERCATLLQPFFAVNANVHTARTLCMVKRVFVSSSQCVCVARISWSFRFARSRLVFFFVLQFSQYFYFNIPKPSLCLIK